MRRQIIAAFQLIALAIAGAASAQTPPPAAPEPAKPAETAGPAASQPGAPQQAAPSEPPAKAPAAVLFTSRPQPPPFMFFSAKNGAFALVGGLAAVAASKQMVTDYDLQDPAKAIIGDLAKGYAEAKGLSVGDSPLVIQSRDPKVALAEAHSRGAQYVLDVTSTLWMVIYFPTDWSHYGVTYGAQLQVIDLATGAAVAKGTCVIKPEKGAEAPDRDALFNNKAAGLKALTAEAAQKCAAKLRTETLKLPAAASVTTPAPVPAAGS